MKIEKILELCEYMITMLYTNEIRPMIVANICHNQNQNIAFATKVIATNTHLAFNVSVLPKPCSKTSQLVKTGKILWISSEKKTPPNLKKLILNWTDHIYQFIIIWKKANAMHNALSTAYLEWVPILFI